MRIAYVRTQFTFNLKSGGSLGHTLGILDGMAKEKHELKLFSNEQFLGSDKFETIVIKPRFFTKKLIWLGQLLYNFYAAHRYQKLIKKFQPDVIYHRYTGQTFFVTRLAKKLKIPIILEFNSFETWTERNWANKTGKKPIKILNTIKYIEAYNLKHADLILPVSEPLRAELIKQGIPKEKILVSFNAINTNKFNPDVVQNSSTIRQKHNIPENAIVAGFSGTFGLWHGVQQLTAAAERILSQKFDLPVYFLFIGNGLLKKDAENALSKFTNAIFTNEVPYSEIQNYLGACDILVSPQIKNPDGTKFFGSPTKIFEYMATGKAIVASDLDQIGEILTDQQTALLSKPNDVEDLTTKITALIKDKELRHKIGQNAATEALKKHTWNQRVHHFIKYCVAHGIIKTDQQS